jgi:hypothetical protein
MAEPSGLGDRLLALRDDLRHRLAADALDATLLARLADVETVLAALERSAPKRDDLHVAEENSTTRPTASRRGGDPNAEQRRKRDDKIRALVPLIAPGKPLEQQAREIAGRLARFRPMPEETSPDRRLMREIAETGLPIGAERIRKILVKQ